MQDDAKERVLRQYGSVGDAYVRSKEHAGGNDLPRLIEAIAPQSHERALDIATGGGHVAGALAPLVNEVVASDLTPGMLDGAERFLTGKGFTNIQYEIADAEALPFAEGSFNLVTCRIAPHHFPNPHRFVSEVARVLVPGGRFGLIDSVVPDGELGVHFNDFERMRDGSHVRSLTVTEWRGLIEGAGLVVELVELIPKRHDFVEWTERANFPAERRAELAAMLLSAGDPARQAFAIETDGDNIVGFTDIKAMVIAHRAG